ncbi:uncharacterized protein LOC135345067 [Halichondria panicea]|uniref:uncharacterized protein LOC135345067 n=1 Tax=Halichondria panicea TaxID=6063 RepID=UPI00312BA775
MKILAVFVAIVIVLAAQPAQLKGAPYNEEAVAKLQGLCAPPFIMTGCGGWKEKEAKQAELQGTHEEAVAKLMTFFEALAMVEGKDDVSLQSSGFRTIGCHQDFLSINPSLHKLQQYGNQFDIEVSCVKHPGSWATCTRVTLRKAYDTFVDLCDIGGLCRRGTSARLFQGTQDYSGATQERVSIPIGEGGSQIMQADIFYKIVGGKLVYLAVENFSGPQCPY